MSAHVASPSGSGRRSAALLAALAIAGAVVASRAAASPQHGPAVSAATAAAPPAPNRCPLTAEKVSSVLGTKVKGPDSSCSFFPADETKLLPSAGYNPQSSMVCTGSDSASGMLREMGYTEKLEGLGVAAYVAEQGDGWWVLVCRSGAPFEVRVDAAPDSAKARAAAAELAKHILAPR